MFTPPQLVNCTSVGIVTIKWLGVYGIMYLLVETCHFDIYVSKLKGIFKGDFGQVWGVFATTAIASWVRSTLRSYKMCWNLACDVMCLWCVSHTQQTAYSHRTDSLLSFTWNIVCMCKSSYFSCHHPLLFLGGFSTEPLGYSQDWVKPMWIHPLLLRVGDFLWNSLPQLWPVWLLN